MNNNAQLGVAELGQTVDLPPIECPYLLASHIPFFRDRAGRLFTDQLWLHDLERHLLYLKNLTIVCPVIDQMPPKGCAPVDSLSQLRIVLVPGATNTVRAALTLPVTIVRMWRAIRAVRIVHSGIAGWPYPTAWIVTPLARALRRKTVIIVESAPWRISAGMPISLRARARAFAYERLGRQCLRQTDLTIFTSDEYRRSLLGNRADAGHVIHASWINEANILSDEQATDSWKEKLEAASAPLRLLFVGQLKSAKGVMILLDAVRQLAARDFPILLDMLGAGELKNHCESLARELRGATRITLLGTTPYGPEFFRLLRRYHGVTVPSISDEQPRIVYDAFSQAVPILGTRTTGLLDCVTEDSTGWLVAPNDAAQLANLLVRAAGNREALHSMGIRSLGVARSMTHATMHQKRHHLLTNLLSHSR